MLNKNYKKNILVFFCLLLLPFTTEAVDPGINFSMIGGSPSRFNMVLATQPTSLVSVNVLAISPATTSFESYIFSPDDWDVPQEVDFTNIYPGNYQGGGAIDTLALPIHWSDDADYSGGIFTSLAISSDYQSDYQDSLASFVGQQLMGIFLPVSLSDTGVARPNYFSEGIGLGNQPLVSFADFNGDGRIDLLRGSSSGDNTMSIYLNGGKNIWTEGAIYDAGFSSSGPFGGSVLVADFNNDNKLDILMANSSSNSLVVLKTDNQGTISPLASISVGQSIDSFSSGDFNGDGHQDIIVAHGVSGDSSHRQIEVFLGDGAGNFASGLVSTFDCQDNDDDTVLSLFAQDFTGDNKADLALNCNSSNSYTKVLKSLGNGSFELTQELASSLSVSFLTSADLNNDGEKDIIAPEGGLSTNFLVYLSNGDGTFQTPQTYPTRLFSLFSSVGDFDNDGHPDLALSALGANTVELWRNQGDGTFVHDSYYPVGGRILNALVDLQGTGFADLVSSWSLSGPVSTQIHYNTYTAPTVPETPSGRPSSNKGTRQLSSAEVAQIFSSPSPSSRPSSLVATGLTAGADKAPTLKLGSRGEFVEFLQAKLIKLKLLKAKPTGYYGVLTKAAIKQFQKKNKLPITGVADQNTLKLLFK